MKHKYIYFLLCCLFLLPVVFVNGQLTYLGLKSENSPLTLDWPESQVIGDSLYVPTKNGIYRKSLKSLTNTAWKLYAFGGVGIRDFIRHNDSILAITTKTTDSLMVLSTDNGRSYVDQTSNFFIENQTTNNLSALFQNPMNTHSILMSHQDGIARSYDFGKSWSESGINAVGLFKINPNDTTNLYRQIVSYADGTQSFRASYDYGKSWNDLSVGMPLVNYYTITFHPTNPNVIFMGCGVFIFKSGDKGFSWDSVTVTDYTFTYSIIYDPSNTQTLYAAGYSILGSDSIRLFRSLDSGNTWSLFYKDNIADMKGVMALYLYENSLIIYTRNAGFYALDLSTAGLLPVEKSEDRLTIYQDPTTGLLTCQSAETIQTARLFDESGRLLKVYKLDSPNFTLDVSQYSRGLYLVLFKTENGVISRKVVLP